MAEGNLTAEQARELLRYDAETGTLYWKKDSFGGFKRSVLIHKAGDLAGGARKDGRKVVRANGALFMSYRVAWLIHFGEWPDGEIDHINGDRTDDRLVNLRVVNRRINQQNIRRSKANKESSEFLGVYLNKKGRGKKWRTSICVDGRQLSLGIYATEEEARDAYIEAKRRLHVGCTL